jgi:DegV family protein with EDD domain
VAQNTMQSVSSITEGYDALDVATNVAVAYVRTHTADLAPTQSVRNAPSLATVTSSTLLLTDVACDLPQAWLDYHGVGVIPRTIKAGANEMVENRDHARGLNFISQLSTHKAGTARSAPLTPIATRDQMQRYMQPATDSIILLCATAKHSKVFTNALSATQSLALIHNKVRRTVGNKTPLTAWVVDSTNALSGLGVLLSHAVTLRDHGAAAADIALTLNAFRRNVHTLVALDELAYAAHASRETKLGNASGLKIMLANLFNYKPVLHINADEVRAVARYRGHPQSVEQILRSAEQQLKQGLATPFISISYAGELGAIESLEAYQSLQKHCNRERVSLALAAMSMTGALTFGPRALAVSFASQHFRP